MTATLRRQYLLVTVLITGYCVLLWTSASTKAVPTDYVTSAKEVLHPLILLVALTGVVWVLMFVFRNLAVATGRADVDYFRDYGSDAPAEWVERPARAFMNLLEVPMLYYLLSVLMLVTTTWDGIQVRLAWLFVLTRYCHAIVYIGFNFVPLRLAVYVMGCLTLAVMWWRFTMAL